MTTYNQNLEFAEPISASKKSLHNLFKDIPFCRTCDRNYPKQSLLITTSLDNIDQDLLRHYISYIGHPRAAPPPLRLNWNDLSAYISQLLTTVNKMEILGKIAYGFRDSGYFIHILDKIEKEEIISPSENDKLRKTARV